MTSALKGFETTVNSGNRIIINTGLPGVILIDRITGIGAEYIDGTIVFAKAPIYEGIESLAQLGAYHVRFLTCFERHAFLFKISWCKISCGQLLDGSYDIRGSLIGKTASSFSYRLQATRDGREGLSPEVHLKGEFLFAAVDYDNIFKKELLQEHYRKVLSCLQKGIKANCTFRDRPVCTEPRLR